MPVTVCPQQKIIWFSAYNVQQSDGNCVSRSLRLMIKSNDSRMLPSLKQAKHIRVHWDEHHIKLTNFIVYVTFYQNSKRSML